MSVFARRFDWRVSDPLDNVLLLDGFVAHPEFLNYPKSPEEARAIGAALLADPNHVVWTTYGEQGITGVVILTRIMPRVDALLHFMFIDRDLASKRKLLQNILGVCFTDFGLNRVSMEVPEGIRLERFARKVLNFRLEGESRPRNPELPKSLTDSWVARQGSRREGGYFTGTEWRDVVLLRLLACEWVGEQGEVECQSQQSSVQPHQSSADSLAKP